MSDQPHIHVLPPLLVNKIAAGEVVERPASVVKELIENALDAGATRITVTIEDGGRQLIRVTDDGRGMTAEDLRLSVVPHATSKITIEDDLYTIGTMGFRGEALASISSVSKLRIVSRRPDAVEGHEIRVAGEKLESSGAAGCPPGTTVEVRDLFFNVPARRKFLKTPATEVGHINEQFARVALAYPHVGMELTNNGRTTQNLPACRHRVERIAAFYSPELASDLMTIEREEHGILLEAYVAPPARSRATNQWQYAFVNGRYIRDRFIQHAIKEAHRGLMEPHRHGVVFLFLTLPPDQLDVNVHPTKIEVRWADSGLIHSQVLSALRETFQRCDLTPTLRTDRAREPIDPALQDKIRREAADAMKASMPMSGGALPESIRVGPGGTSSGGSGYGGGGGYAGGEAGARSGDLFNSPRGVDAGNVWRSLYAAPDGSPSQETGATGPAPPESPPVRRAVQMHNLYLVAETEDGIVIVDQHALHERVMYEQLCERFTSGPLESQRLLLPETIRVTPKQAALLETHADLLHKLGLEVTSFGSDSMAVHAFPALLNDTDVQSFMADLLDHLDQQAGHALTEVVIHKILDMMACKAAIKAGDALGSEEIEALMQQRHLLDKPSNCPHGRPTTLRLSKADLERQFKRT